MTPQDRIQLLVAAKLVTPEAARAATERIDARQEKAKKSGRKTSR